MYNEAILLGIIALQAIILVLLGRVVARYASEELIKVVPVDALKELEDKLWRRNRAILPPNDKEWAEYKATERCREAVKDLIRDESVSAATR